MPSSFQNPDPFSHPFSDLASDINFCFQTCLAGMMTVIRLECQQKEFLILKCISKSHITCSFLSIWNYSDLIYSLWISRIQMLSTLWISLPANLNFFFSDSVCLKTWVMSWNNQSKRQVQISSAIFQTCLIRCCSFVHFRLYYIINAHFFVLKLISSHVVFGR